MLGDVREGQFLRVGHSCCVSKSAGGRDSLVSGMISDYLEGKVKKVKDIIEGVYVVIGNSR